HDVRHIAATVAAVHPDAHELELEGGDRVGYDALLVAVGARPQVWLDGAVTFRGHPDVQAVKDVLAEDFVLGRRIAGELGKRVVVAGSAVLNVSERRSVSAFLDRYRRWAVMQHKAAGTAVYAAGALLQPVPLAAAALALRPSLPHAAVFAFVCLSKGLLDVLNVRKLVPGAAPLRAALWVPVKDLLFATAWAHGLFNDRIDWRGTQLVVLEGTWLAPLPDTRERTPSAEAA
ncbi:MAG: glycosyltransferase, partial [Myxococcales bacterium]